jgi:hypothetical protein
LWLLLGCFEGYFGGNNSQKPHTASTNSYKKYSKLKLRSCQIAELQNFKNAQISKSVVESTPARRLGNGHAVLA